MVASFLGGNGCRKSADTSILLVDLTSPLIFFRAEPKATAKIKLVKSQTSMFVDLGMAWLVDAGLT